MASERLTESAIRDSTSTKMKENEGSSSRDTVIERHGKGTENDDGKVSFNEGGDADFQWRRSRFLVVSRQLVLSNP